MRFSSTLNLRFRVEPIRIENQRNNQPARVQNVQHQRHIVQVSEGRLAETHENGYQDRGNDQQDSINKGHANAALSEKEHAPHFHQDNVDQSANEHGGEGPIVGVDSVFKVEEVREHKQNLQKGPDNWENDRGKLQGVRKTEATFLVVPFRVLDTHVVQFIEEDAYEDEDSVDLVDAESDHSKTRSVLENPKRFPNNKNILH